MNKFVLAAQINRYPRSLIVQAIFIATLAACDTPAPAPLQEAVQDSIVKAKAPVFDVAFRDVTQSAGLVFRHEPGLTGKYFMPEIIGSGVALFDYDSDGDLDLYLVQAGKFDSEKVSSEKIDGNSIESLEGAAETTDRLFRNLLIEHGELSFEDVTDAAGIVASGYGMGVAVADYDNDGHPDLLVTNFGDNQLFRNLGDGTFEDATKRARLSGNAWSSSAAFVDYDLDGDADLFITNYVAFSPSQNFECTSEGGQRDYCGPQTYLPQVDQMFENLGNGTFKDVSAAVGFHSAYGPGLGVAVFDSNADGYPDIFVANDGAPNQLWINSSGQSFADEGLMSGTSLNADGASEAGMGVMSGDFDNDGDEDLFMTHLKSETNTLYLNDGAGFYFDATDQVNLGASSLAMTGFGAGWLDVDNDGWVDLLIANGNVKLETERIGKSDYPFEQRNQLLWNMVTEQGARQFVDVSAQAGEAFAKLAVSRGVAIGDLNNDGYTDAIITNNNGAAEILLNQLDGNDWLGVQLIDSEKRFIEQAVVTVRASWGDQVRRVRRSGSYLSAHDSRLQFGLAQLQVGEKPGVHVEWPDGSKESWAGLAPRQYHTLRRGSGTKAGTDEQHGGSKSD